MKTDAKHDSHAGLRAEVAAAETELVTIRELVEAAESMTGEKAAALAHTEAMLDAGAIDSDPGELVRVRAAQAGEHAAAAQALVGRRARFKLAESRVASARQQLARAQLEAGREQLRQAEAALVEELLVEVRKIAVKSLTLLEQAAQVDGLIVPAALDPVRSGRSALPLTDALVEQIGAMVAEVFAVERERARQRADQRNVPAAVAALEVE